MKFVIAVAFMCLTVVAQAAVVQPSICSLGSTFGTGALQNTIQGLSDVNNDIMDFIDLLPIARIRAIISKYLQNDRQVQLDQTYAASSPVEDLLTMIEDSPEAKFVTGQLQQGAADVTYLVSVVQDTIQFSPMPTATTDMGGMKAMLDEIFNIIPMIRIKLLAATKYILSPAFRKLADIINSAQFKSSLHALLNSEKVLALEKDAQAHGVDVSAIHAFVSDLQTSYSTL